MSTEHLIPGRRRLAAVGSVNSAPQRPVEFLNGPKPAIGAGTALGTV